MCRDDTSEVLCGVTLLRNEEVNWRGRNPKWFCADVASELLRMLADAAITTRAEFSRWPTADIAQILGHSAARECHPWEYTASVPTALGALVGFILRGAEKASLLGNDSRGTQLEWKFSFPTLVSAKWWLGEMGLLRRPDPTVVLTTRHYKEWSMANLMLALNATREEADLLLHSAGATIREMGPPRRPDPTAVLTTRHYKEWVMANLMLALNATREEVDLLLHSVNNTMACRPCPSEWLEGDAYGAYVSANVALNVAAPQARVREILHGNVEPRYPVFESDDWEERLLTNGP
ncbi:hypothetical protein DL769_004604 [Monosporascus sp. CRB-8-3]|nr:hypothetical protein DL769_004604 [Monosporascus sp. CRB-8-3]